MENLSYVLEQEIKTRCNKETNFFGPTAFYHIKSVEENAEFLADKIGNVDKEVIIAASWLHDVASITKKEYYEEHHIYGAEIAEDLLKQYHYPEEKIALVKKCIINHRGSILKEKLSKEEQIVADADAISHFDQIPSLFYLAFHVRGLSYEEGFNFVKNKLQRSYNKLSQQGKKIYKEKYQEVMKVLGED